MTPIEDMIRAKHSLNYIKDLMDSVNRGTVIIPESGNDDFANHIITLPTLFMMIRKSAYVGLGLGLPKT